MAKMTKEQIKQEREWRAMDDARIMAQYQEIMQDKARMNRAVKQANKEANELQKRASVMKRVANKKGNN